MADPTREQYNAAAKKVMETAKPGLSREEFYSLVEAELNRSAGPGQGISTESLVSGRPTSFDDSQEGQSWADRFHHMEEAVKPPSADASSLDRANWLAGNAIPVAGVPGLPALAKMLPESVQGVLRGVRSGVGSVMEPVGQFLQDYNIFHPVKPIGDLIRKGGEALRAPSNEEAITAFRGTPQPPAPKPSVTVRPSTPDLIDKYRKPAATPTAASPRLVKGEGSSLEDVLQDLLSKGDEGGGASFMAPETAITDAAPLRQSGTFPAGAKDANGLPLKLGQPGGYTSGRPATTLDRFNEIDETIPRQDIIPEPTGDPSFVSPGEESGYNATRETDVIPDSAQSAQESLRSDEEIGMEGMPSNPVDALAEKMRRLSGDFTHTKSHRTAKSTIPGAKGLTENDIGALEGALADKIGVKPRITGIRPNQEAEDVMLEARRKRSANYAAGAETDRPANNAIEDFLNSLFNRR